MIIIGCVLDLHPIHDNCKSVVHRRVNDTCTAAYHTCSSRRCQLPPPPVHIYIYMIYMSWDVTIMNYLLFIHFITLKMLYLFPNYMFLFAFLYVAKGFRHGSARVKLWSWLSESLLSLWQERVRIQMTWSHVLQCTRVVKVWTEYKPKEANVGDKLSGMLESMQRFETLAFFMDIRPDRKLIKKLVQNLSSTETGTCISILISINFNRQFEHLAPCVA